MSEREAPPDPQAVLDEIRRKAAQATLDKIRAKAAQATAPVAASDPTPPPSQPESSYGLLRGMAGRPVFQGVSPARGVPSDGLPPEPSGAFDPGPTPASRLGSGDSLDMGLAQMEQVPGRLMDELGVQMPNEVTPAQAHARRSDEADAALEQELIAARSQASNVFSHRIAEIQAYMGRGLKYLTDPFSAIQEATSPTFGGRSTVDTSFEMLGAANEVANQGVQKVTGLNRVDSQGLIDVGTAGLGVAKAKLGKARSFSKRTPIKYAENVRDGQVPFDQARAEVGDRVVGAPPEGGLPASIRLREAFVDKNAAAPVLERSLGKTADVDTGSGPGSGKGITAELAAAEGATAHKAVSFLESGRYQQGLPPELKDLPHGSFLEALDHVGGKEGLDLAGVYAVAKRESTRYHSKGTRGDFTPEQAKAIIKEVEGNPDKYRGVLDVVKRMDAETRFLARELDRAGGAGEKFFQATQGEGLYVHLDRIIDDAGSRPGGKARSFARVKGSSDRVRGTVNPIVSHEKIVKQYHEAIAKARQNRELAKLAEKGGAIEPIATPTIPIKASVDQVRQALEAEGIPFEVADDAATQQSTLTIWKRRGELSNEFVTFEIDPKTGKRVEKWYRVNGELPQRVLDLVQDSDSGPKSKIAQKVLGIAQAAVTAKRLGTTALSPGFIAANFLIDSTVALKQTSLKTKTFSKVPILKELPGREFAREGVKATAQALHESFRVALKPFGVKMKQLPEWAAFDSSGSIAHSFGKNDPTLVYTNAKRRATMRGEGFFEDTFKSLTKGKAPKWVDFYGTKDGAKYLVLDPIKYATDVMSPFEGVFRKSEQRGLLKREGFTDPNQVLPDEVANRAQNAGARVTLSFQRGGTVTKAANRYALPFVNAWVQGLYTDAKLLKHRPQEYRARTLAMMGAGAALWLMNRDQESYRDAPDWRKATYVGIYSDDGIDVPGVGKTNALLAFRAREHLAPMKAIEATLESIYRSDPEVAVSFAKELGNAFNYSLTQSFVGAPAYEVATGRSLFRDQPINPRGTENMADVLPGDVAHPDTSTLARKLASTEFGLTAAEVQFVMDNVAGQTPGHLVRGFEAATGTAPEDSRTAEAKHTPFFGRFMGGLNESQAVRDFYQLRSEVQGFSEAESRFKREGSQERLIDVSVDRKGKRDVQEVSDAMRSLAEQYRTAKTDEARMGLAKRMREMAKTGLRALKRIDPRARVGGAQNK